MQQTAVQTDTSSISLLIWILVILAILLTGLLLWWTLRKARQRAVGKQTPAPESAPSYRNVGIPFSFGRGIGFLKGRAAGRDYRYQVPWILMLGGYQSGTSTVLANAGVSTPLDGEGGPAFGLAQGLEWWFYQRGLVLNPPSDMVLRSDGRTSDDNGFDLFLNWLQRKRPRRPLDGVVLTVSAEDLLDHSGRADLIVKASLVRQKLSLILRRTSMRLPVYVLVTKCDYVPGFAAYAAELSASHNDMFGWSNPYPFDAAFSPDWVAQGFEEMDIQIAEQQMDVFVERSPVEDADGVFLFPGEFQRLRDPLRTFLIQALQDNAYEESFFFRGFYFCGDATLTSVSPTELDTAVEPAAEEEYDEIDRRSTDLSILPGPLPTVTRERKPVFLYDLFAAKIFPESHLAKPLSRIDMSRNRTVRTARILTAAFVLIAGVGTLVAGMRLHWFQNDHLGPLLDATLVDMEIAGHHVAGETESSADRGTRVKSVSHTAGEVLSSMALLSDRRFGSVFFPASWNNRVEQDLENGLALAFQDVVLKAFRGELESRLSTIIAATTPAPSSETDEKRSFDTPGSVPEHRAWLQYIDNLKQLELNAERYNRIATPGRGSIDDFRELVKYLKFTAGLPEGFDFDNPFFKRILAKAVNAQFDYAQATPPAMNHASNLIKGFFLNWYGPRNRIAMDAENVALGIQSFMQQRTALPYGDLSNLSTDIGTLADDLQNPTFDWVSEGEVPKDLVSLFTQPFDTLTLLQGMNARQAQSPATQDFLKFRVALHAKSTALTGPILDMALTPVEISGSVSTLRENLSYLLGQTFVVREPGPPMQITPARYLWDRATLVEAQKLFDAYDRFDRGSLRSMPSYMSSVLRRIAQDRLQGNVLDLIGQAQNSVSTAPAAEIDQELKDFNQCLDVFDQLMTGFGKFQNHTWQRNFTVLLQNQAMRMLAVLNGELGDSNPYGVKGGGFDWWEGERPFAPEAYEVRTPDDLKEYLDRTREQLSTLAQEADPLLRFIETKLPSNGTSAPAVNHLQSLVTELKRYSEKKPGNSVTLLEDFIQTGMDKIAPDGTCQDTVRDPVGRSDLFIVKRAALRAKVLERCRVLSQRAYTNQIAGTFNSKLAGRFPFSAPGHENSAPEAEPAALAEFLNKFDQYGKIATDTLKNSPANPSRDSGLAFLSQIGQIRPVFSAFLAGFDKDPVPSFDFAVAFRVNPVKAIDVNQVAEWGLDVGQQSFRYRGKDNTGHWRLGDPIRVTLRFADDSPLLPVADPSQPDLLVNRRTVSFEFGGMWSLFRLLLSHKANRGELDITSQRPHLLSFYIPTVPDRNLPQPKDGAVGGLVRVYVQLTVIPPGAKEGTLVPLPFPDLAPKAGDIVTQEVAQE